MPITKTIQAADKTFIVREMSVNEVRIWWDNVRSPCHERDITNESAVPGISLDDLAMICGCTVEEFDDMRPSELAPLVEAAKELNPHFFRLRELIIETSIKIVETLTKAYADTVTAIVQGEAHEQP